MNKRRRKKKLMLDDRETFYIKLLINKNDKYNPKIKIKGWKNFIKGIKYFSKKYNCDVAFKSLTLDKRMAEDILKQTKG